MNVLVGVALIGSLLAPAPAWTDGEPVPLGRIRYAHTQCERDPDRLYVLGGLDDRIHPTITAPVHDTSTGRWDRLEAVPQPLQGAVAICAGNQIHLLGGLDHRQQTTDTHYVYDLVKGGWTQRGPLPRKVWGAAGGQANGKLYLMGGDDNDDLRDGVSGRVDVYDTATGRWSAGKGMPVPVVAAGSVQSGRGVYVVGGWDLSSGTLPARNVAASQRFDLATETWSVGPDLPDPPADFALAATGSALYAIGGDADGGGYHDASDAVRRLAGWTKGSWTTEPDRLPVRLAANSAGYCADGRIWSVGGAQDPQTITGRTLSRDHPEGCSLTF